MDFVLKLTITRWGNWLNEIFAAWLNQGIIYCSVCGSSNLRKYSESFLWLFILIWILLKYFSSSVICRFISQFICQDIYIKAKNPLYKLPENLVLLKKSPFNAKCHRCSVKKDCISYEESSGSLLFCMHQHLQLLKEMPDIVTHF